MLTPRLTDCVECTTIPSLLENINCKIFEVAKSLYNNTVFALNRPINQTVMLDLLNYQRILTYKYCNPDYASHYSINQIASRVKILTGNCKSKCTDKDLPPLETTTTSSSTTTTTTTLIPGLELRLVWDNIVNVPVSNVLNLDEWNTLFDFPNQGYPFTNVSVSENTVILHAPDIEFVFTDNIFLNNSNLIAVSINNMLTFCYIAISTFQGCINLTSINIPTCVSIAQHAFDGCVSLSSFIISPLIDGFSIYTFKDCVNLFVFDYPNVIGVGSGAFQGCINATTFNLPSATFMGGNQFDNLVFDGIIGQTITITIPSILMTNNGGLPDGDIQYLIDNNTVTVIQV